MKNSKQAATLTAENYLEIYDSIKKMNSKQFDNFIWAMYQGKDYPAFGKGKWVEADMWNYAQCINDNYDFEDEDELNTAKNRVIRFFEGDKDDYTDEEWDNFKKVTGVFLASYFEQEVAKQQAATSNAKERKNIENYIGEFISHNYDKDFATGEKELRDGWTLRVVYYDVDGYGFTDVLLTNHELEPTLHCGTIKAGGDIPQVAEVCVDMMAVPDAITRNINQ